jgi:hypothetical protein
MEIILAREAPSLNLSLPCVLSLERDGRNIRLLVKGDINPLLRELANLEVEDLIYEQASLEDIFLEFYSATPA